VLVPSAITLNGRNTNAVAIENLSGSNTLAGGLTINVGGGYYLLQSDGAGTLNLGGIISSVATGTRTFTFQGNGNFYVSGSIQNGSASTIVLLKTNAGVLTIAGASTFSGATTNYRGSLVVNGSLASSLTVAGGTLGGSGSVGGATTIQSGAALSPGNSVGTLTFGSSLTLAAGSTNIFEINQSLRMNDAVNVAGVLNYGGTLIVTNLSGNLTAGENFKLFNAKNYSGNFSSLHLPPLGTNLVWNTSGLSNGVLSVALGAVAPQVGQISLTGTNLVFRGGGGAAGYPFTVLGSPDLTLPLMDWNVIGTGTFDGDGNFIFSNGINPQPGTQFYQIKIQ
jgi:autotransporter-associated beta strand protein